MDYYSLDLQITEEPGGFLNLYRASILENGDIKATRTFELQHDLKLVQMLDRIEEKALIPLPQPKETVHIEFGKMLYSTVFSGELGDFFNKSFNKTQEEDCGLRVSLQISEDIPEITTLPWEFLHDGEEFLIPGRNILLSRLPFGVERINTQPIESILHMLVIISSPDDPSIPPLNTEKEQEVILEAIDKLHKEQRIKVDFTEDATLENIQGYLKDQDYHVVYFTGHGISFEGKGHLVFETEDRKAKLIDNKTLANLFSEKGIRLVVLSSCESAKGSNKEAYGDIASVLLKQGIPAVVAMQYSVSEDVALNFALNFLKAVTNEDPVDLAFEKARSAMKISEKSNGFNFATPVMYLSDCNCLKVKEIKQEPTESENTPLMLSDLQVMKKGFVARKKELRNLERDFSSNIKRIAIIHGLGGAGKTVLATRLALKMSEDFDGIFGMKCTSITQPKDILVKINDFLKMKGENEFNQILNKPIPLEEKTSLLVDILNQQNILIIFDNFGDCLNEERNDIRNPELKAFLIQLLSNTISNTKFIITTRYDFDPLGGKLPESIDHISLPEFQFPQTNWLMNDFDKMANLSFRKKRQIYNVIGGHPWIIGQFALLSSSQRVDDILMELESLKKKFIEFTLLEKLYSKLDEKSKLLLLCASIYEEAVPIEALSWIVGDEKDASPNVGESLKKLLQLGLISKEQKYDINIYSEYTIVKDYVRNKLEENKLDKNGLAFRAGRYFENLASQTCRLRDYLKARDYYFQAEDWKNANQIVESIIIYLIRFGNIELAMNLLKGSINTISGDSKINAEYILATIYHLLGDLNKALKLYNDIKNESERMGNNRWVAITLHALGIINEGQGNYEEAIEQCKQSLKIAEELGDEELIALVLYHQGVIYQKQGKYVEGVADYNQTLRIAEQLGDEKLIAHSLYQLGTIHQSKGNFKEAMDIYIQVLKTYNEVGEKRGTAQILHQLGTIFLRKGSYEDAIAMYNQSIKIKEELNDKSGIALTLYQLGMIHQNQGNYKEAVIMQSQSLRIKEELGDKEGIAQSLLQLGVIDHKRGRYKEAMDWCSQSLQINEEIGDKAGIAYTYQQLGIIHFDQGNYEEALIMHNQSLEIKEELGDKRGIAQSLHELGVIFHLQGDYEEALLKYNRSLDIDKELGDKSGTAATLHTIGIIYKDQDNFEEALTKYNQSLKIWKELGDKRGAAHTMHQIGNIYFEQENYKEALSIYNKSLEIGEYFEDINLIASTLHQIGRINEEEEDYSIALRSFFISSLIFEQINSPYKEIVLKSLSRLQDKMGEDKFDAELEKIREDGFGTEFEKQLSK